MTKKKQETFSLNDQILDIAKYLVNTKNKLQLFLKTHNINPDAIDCGFKNYNDELYNDIFIIRFGKKIFKFYFNRDSDTEEANSQALLAVEKIGVIADILDQIIVQGALIRLSKKGKR